MLLKHHDSAAARAALQEFQNLSAAVGLFSKSGAKSARKHQIALIKRATK
ncbi:hypothetical protein JIN80_08255 [Cerasicoccus arenae]|nr:hypothetical protein [Cerasicoccus arenae]